MRVERVSFVAVRTEQRDTLVAFFRDVLGMTAFVDVPSLVALRLAGGDVVEVFPGNDEGHAHFGTAPVVGFEVEDIESAHAELSSAPGIELLSPIQHGSMGSSWFHFRGPDGNVYELLTSAPSPTPPGGSEH